MKNTSMSSTNLTIGENHNLPFGSENLHEYREPTLVPIEPNSVPRIDPPLVLSEAALGFS